MLTLLLWYIGVGMFITLLLLFLLTITGQSISGVLKDHDKRLEQKPDLELEIKFTVLCVLLWPVVIYGASMTEG